MIKLTRFIAIFSIMLFTLPVEAVEPVNVYFFYGQGCPHCASEEKFLEKLEQEGVARILRYEIWQNKDNAQFLSRLGKELDLNISGVPVTIVGEKVFFGYFNDSVTGSQIYTAVSDCGTVQCGDVVKEIFEKDKKFEKEKARSGLPEKINLPVFGEVNVKNFSLPVLTVLIAAVDGFNPCAMWVLIFLIGLLLGMQNKKRMWLLGSAFIFSSAAVYFLFLSAWLNLFLFLGVIFLVRLVIGLVALASGGYHLKEWWVNREGVCKVTGGEKRKLIFTKLKEIIEKKKFIIALLGIIILAAAVNLVELICSAGLPAVYTQILSLSSLAKWQYYAYLIFYVFIFMLDDLLIFSLAMLTLRTKTLTAGYSRWSNLIGGVIMVMLGILLIFKPAWLMLG